MRFSWLLVLGLVSCGARSGLYVDGGDGGGAPGGGGGEEGGGGAGAGGGGVGGVEQLALGAGHSCVRTARGEVYCWGRNGDGQVGNGEDGDVRTPARVHLDEPATYLASGSYHACAIGLSGDLYCWGRGDAGTLGDGLANDSRVPVRAQMSAFEGRTLESLALGEAHSCAVARRVDGDGELFCWGSGESAQIGQGPNTSSLVPVPVAAPVEHAAAGGFFTAYLGPDGVVSCFGDNSQRQCGIEGSNIVGAPTPVPDLVSPVSLVRSGRGRHTCAAEPGGVLRCWGDNSEGQVGAAPSELVTPGDAPALPFEGLADVQAGYAHSCALARGTVSCWGLNLDGQLGTPGPSHSDPAPVPGMTGVIAIGVGTIHSCAMRSPTEIFCWGGNAFGQLGDGSTSPNSSVPVPVVLP